MILKLTNRDDISDSQLCGLLKKENEFAFTELYNRYHLLLFIYVVKKTRDQEVAKEIVQEVFISLWNNRFRCDEIRSISGYLYRSARNKALDVFAHQKVEQKYIDSLNNFLAFNHCSADELLHQKEIEQTIDNAINSLSPKMKQVFLLSRKSYFTNKEISTRLDISEEAVKKNITRALKILRIKLQKAVLSIYFF